MGLLLKIFGLELCCCFWVFDGFLFEGFFLVVGKIIGVILLFLN